MRLSVQGNIEGTERWTCSSSV